VDELRTWVANLVLRNWHLKVLSLVLAALSYYAIRNATSLEVPYDVPIRIEVEKGIAVLDQDPRTVEVTFRGSQEDLLRLERAKLRVSIKMDPELVAGPETVAISPNDVKGASGVRVVKLKSDTVSVTFDRETQKQLQVTKPQVVGKPLIGHVELDYEPKTVSVRGSKLRLQDKQLLETEPVDVDGRVESFSKEVRVLPPKDMSDAKIEPPVVLAKLNIVTEAGTREWTNVLVRAVMKPGEIRDVFIEPPSVTVSVQGRSELLAALSMDMVDAFVDCAGLDPSGTYELPVCVYLPKRPDVTSSVSPGTVKVVVREASQ